jgi:predicted membrane channel-forming protein YqfA (hemolysin III family)
VVWNIPVDISDNVSQAAGVLHGPRIMGKITSFGYLAIITFIAATVLWSVLVATRKQEICLLSVNIYSFSFWAIPFAWALFVFTLVFTVKERRGRNIRLLLFLLLVLAIFVFLKIAFKDLCLR